MTSQKKIQLTGYIDVPPHRLDEISAALPEHIRLTRLETGCIRFEVRADPHHAGRFNVTESFASRADFDQHQNRTKSSEWAHITDDIPRSYSIDEID